MVLSCWCSTHQQCGQGISVSAVDWQQLPTARIWDQSNCFPLPVWQFSLPRPPHSLPRPPHSLPRPRSISPLTSDCRALVPEHCDELAANENLKRGGREGEEVREWGSEGGWWGGEGVCYLPWWWQLSWYWLTGKGGGQGPWHCLIRRRGLRCKWSYCLMHWGGFFGT